MTQAQAVNPWNQQQYNYGYNQYAYYSNPYYHQNFPSLNGTVTPNPQTQVAPQQTPVQPTTPPANVASTHSVPFQYANTNVAPAYTSVKRTQQSQQKVTTGFTGFQMNQNKKKKIPELVEEPKPNPPADDKNKWPDALKSFVERAFARCKEPAEKQAVEVQLKPLITGAIEHGTLWSHDWASQPLPPLPPKRKQPSFDPNPFQNESKKNARSSRFMEQAHAHQQRSRPPPSTHQPTETYEDRELNWDAYTIKGTSQQLEKQYLRLTEAPEPWTVRPEPVLKKSLEHVLKKWEAQRDYLFVCEQIKSIRQDLTVQRINNEFTVLVYETHGRLTLENDDLGEFNQCQSRLKTLYEDGIRGCIPEFMAYRLLYSIYRDSASDIIDLLKDLTVRKDVKVSDLSNVKKDPAVVHALALRSAINLENYASFFKLYPTTPNKGKFILDKIAPRIRLEALRKISKR
eukprot:TRINITY_DN2547_c1_g1_i1.p1 TRINITY_DN2547_c1_g1~~TRINITY_DN2547_c1_g1_i1.p1  ORF type:complete len:518 (-),score=137.84 TRINITY_DN2547_c1_g1_i1:307-1680(-)